MEEKHLVELFQDSVEKNESSPAMRYKRGGAWHTVTYAGMARFVEDLAGGLLDLGIEPGDRVAIWSGNSPEWVISDYATLHLGAVSAPIYDTLTGDQAAYILADCEAKVAFIENEEKLDEVLNRLGELPELEALVMMGPAPEGYEGKDNVHGMDELYARGRSYLDENPDALAEHVEAIEPDQVASFVYTSGTTGNPKGVVLTHWNFASNVLGTAEVLPLEGQVHLNFLPLCHSFARVADQFAPYSYGSTVAFAESVDTLVDNMQEIHPTVMGSVPRLYEKMKAKIEQGAQESGGIKLKLFNWAMDVGREVAHRKAEGEDIPAGLNMKYKVAETLVFKKIHQVTGGNLEFFISGGAALSQDIQEFFASAGIWIMQGYGLTETSPVISVNTPDNFRFGSVGKTIPEVDVRINEEVWDGPEGEGEIQVQGPNTTQGYYGLTEETEALFTEDGWLRTGDVGRLDEDGFLYITDRLKQIFKTAYGKYIVPNKLEAKLKDRPFIAQPVIIGESKKFVSALLVPDFERLEGWAKEQDLSYEDHGELVQLDEVEALIQDQVDAVNEDLARYESIKTFRLLPKELTVEDGELTPTMKVKMRVVEDRYAEEIASMYPDE